MLDELGLLGPHTCIAHGVHLIGRRARAARRARRARLHCPSSNLKLASGIAPLPELIAAGVSVALGADGAPCNNNLDGFIELRLAALLHKPRSARARCPLRKSFGIATLGGAAALGLADRDRLARGRQARRRHRRRRRRRSTRCPTASPWSQIAYAAKSCDVRHVAVDGNVVVRDRELLTLDLGKVQARASGLGCAGCFAEIRVLHPASFS